MLRGQSGNSRGLAKSTENGRVRPYLMIIIVFLLLTALAMAQDARWLYFGKDANNERYYYDYPSMHATQQEVDLWVRKFPKYVPLGPSGSSPIGEVDLAAIYNDEKTYPGTDDFHEFRWKLYKNRHLKQFSSGVWSQLIPIPPETMAEVLWQQMFSQR